MVAASTGRCSARSSQSAAVAAAHRDTREVRVLGEDLGVDRFRGPPVLAGEPIISQVQVDPGRLDRRVPGLGLDRLQRHPRFAQPGQTGMPQLMTGRVREPGTAARTVEDFIDAIGRKRPPAAGAFEHHKHSISARQRAVRRQGSRRPR